MKIYPIDNNVIFVLREKDITKQLPILLNTKSTYLKNSKFSFKKITIKNGNLSIVV